MSHNRRLNELERRMGIRPDAGVMDPSAYTRAKGHLAQLADRLDAEHPAPTEPAEAEQRRRQGVNRLKERAAEARSGKS